MKKFLPITLIFFYLHSTAQISSKGNENTFIKGAKNKVDYLIRHKSTYNIPDNMVNYVAGLLMINRIDKKDSLNNAVMIWLKKYNDLTAKVNFLPRGDIRTQANQQLNLGNFPVVERLLAMKSDYHDFKRIFSNAIQITGDQNTVIYGDYNNVTYSVSEVIQYNLPEGVTLNLLNQLKAKDNELRKKGDNIQELQSNLSDKKELLHSWISRYQQIVDQLRNSPDKIQVAAAKKFENGDLDGALVELNKTTGTEVNMANNRLLKARIMTLQFDYHNLDSQLETVRMYYQTSVPLIPNFTNYMEYCRFLVDFSSDYLTALPILQKAIPLANSLKNKVEALNYLAICFTAIGNRLEAQNEIKIALELLDQNEPLSDDDLIEKKGVLQFNMGMAFAYNNAPQANIKTSTNFCVEAISTMQRVKGDIDGANRQIAIIQLVLGKGISLQGNLKGALTTFKTAQQFYEKQIKKQPQIWLGLSQLYLNLGETFFNLNKLDSSIYYLQKSRLLVEPNVDIHNKILFIQLSLIYSDLVSYYQQRNLDSAKYYLLHLDQILDPLYNEDQNYFGLSRASIYTDLGTIYNVQGKYNEAIETLENAYHLFVKNVAIIQGNPIKFNICVIQLSSTYNSTYQFPKSIAFNHDVVTKIADAEVTNPTIFQMIEPQANSLIAATFYNWGKLDSALIYIKKALAPTETNVKQYSLLYIDPYINYTSQLIQIFAASDNISGVNQTFKHFETLWNDIYSMSAAADTLQRTKVGEAISNFAFGYFQQMISRGDDPQKIYSLCNSYFDIAESQMLDDPQQAKNNFVLLQQANFYYRRALLEQDMSIKTFADNLVSHKHNERKCIYIKKSRMLLNKAPSTLVAINLKNALDILPNADCQ